MRYRALWPLGLMLALAAGCETPDGAARRMVTNASPSVSPAVTPATGEGGASPTPGPEATPTPSASPSAPPPQATSIYVTPEQPTVYLPPGAGSDPALGLPVSVRLFALVTKSNGSTEAVADWTSLDPTLLTVDGTGLVTAVGAGSGPGPWTVGVRATSRDGRALMTRLVTVVAEGGVAVDVE